MHPKYWKFPSGRRFMDAATGDEGGNTPGGAPNPTPDPTPAADEPQADDQAPAGKKPSDEEARLLKEVMKKKEALKQTETDLAAAKARLQEFEGIDPAAVRKLIADQTAAEEAQLVARGEFDTLKARMADEHGKATQALNATIAELTEKLAGRDRVVDELSVGQQFAQSQLIAEELTMPASKVRALYGNHFDVVDGKVVAFDKPRGEANRAPLVDQFGNGVGFEDALRKICEADPDADHLFRSKAKPGAGSESRQNPKVVPPVPAQLDSVSKIAGGLKSLNLLMQTPK